MSNSTEKPWNSVYPEPEHPATSKERELEEEMARIKQEVARRIADNRRFLERFMDLAQELDDDNPAEEEIDEEL